MELSHIVTEIEEKGVFTLDLVTEQDELSKLVQSGKHEFALVLNEEDFHIIVGIESHNVSLLEQLVKGIYVQNAQYDVLAEASHVKNITEEIEKHRVFNVYSISVLLLMTVVLTGIGIHLMERKYVS